MPFSFKVVVCTAILCSIATFFPLASAHRCIHGTPEMQNEIRASLAKGPRHVEYRRFHAESMENIRINFGTSNLENPDKYCSSASGTKPNFQQSGQVLSCTAYDVLTAEKIDIIKTKIMPAAVQGIQELLKVNRISGALPVGSNDCGSNYIIPSADTSPGVNNTDFMIYVSAGPLGNTQVLAYAAPCINDPMNRPLVGRINFNPYFVAWDTLSPSYKNEELISTAQHEILHAMGFTSSFFNVNNRSRTDTARGKAVSVIHTPTVVDMARKYFNCSSITGVEIEDEGSAGSAGAHWDRRILFEELMAASAGNRLSVFTLAFLKDLGFYDADFSKATPMTFGKNVGCPFVTSKCNDAAAGGGSLWCLAVTETKSCTHNYHAIGKCNAVLGTSDLPTQFQYFTDPKVGGKEFVDRCPYIGPFSNRECAFQKKADVNDAAEAELGFYFGDGGRCFNTDALHKSGSSSADNLRCLRSRCPFNGTRIEVKIGEVWKCCPIDGTAGTITPPPQFEGNVHCPTAASFCDHLVSFGSNLPESKPVGNVEMSFNDGPMRVTAEIIFNGTLWERVMSTDRQRVDLFNSIRLDVAQFLSISSASVRIRRATLIDSGKIVNKGLAVLVGLVEDNQHAIDSQIYNGELSKRINKAEPIPYTRDAYARANPGTSETTTIAGYLVEEKISHSICSSNITPDRCIMIVGICVTIGSAIIIAIIMYCLCFKSPFDVPPQPKGLSTVQ